MSKVCKNLNRTWDADKNLTATNSVESADFVVPLFYSAIENLFEGVMGRGSLSLSHPFLLPPQFIQRHIWLPPYTYQQFFS